MPEPDEVYGFCPGCPGNKAKRSAATDSQKKSLRDHVLRSDHTNYGLGKLIWNCQGCDRNDFGQKSKFERHFCFQKKVRQYTPDVQPVKYTRKRTHKQIYQQAKKWSPSVMYDVAFEEKWSLPGLYPAFKEDCNFHSAEWKWYGTPKPNLLYETILKDNNLLGKNDFLFIDKYIDIHDEDGTLLICVGPEHTKPNTDNSKLEVTEHGDSHYMVAFRNPSPRNHLSLTKPVLDEAGLGVYKYCKKGPGFTHHPHAYPAEVVRHVNPFVSPYITSDGRFSKQVGMRTRKFWMLCDSLKQSGLKRRRHLPIDAMVSLYRTKMRQDINFCLLSTMYGAIDEKVRSSNTSL